MGARLASVAATAVSVLSLTLASGPLPTTAAAIDDPGGVAAPAAKVPTSGTGGAAYAAVSPKPRPVVKKKAVKRKVARKPSTPKPAPAPSGAPTPAQTLSEGAVFPVRGAHSFGGPENRFGAGRVGHIHQGQDVLASEGLEVLAPLPGTIITTGYQAGGAGWYVAEQVADGLSFFYAHCQAGSIAVRAEQAVRAGQRLCLVGQTGDATGPHLHFEVWVGGWHVGHGYPIDPLPYLEAWDR